MQPFPIKGFWITSTPFSWNISAYYRNKAGQGKGGTLLQCVPHQAGRPGFGQPSQGLWAGAGDRAQHPGAAGDRNGTRGFPPASEHPRGSPASTAGAERVPRLPIPGPGERGQSPAALSLPRHPARLTPSLSAKWPRAAGAPPPSLHKAPRQWHPPFPVSLSRCRDRGPAPPPAPTALRPARSALPSGRLLGNALFRPARSQSQRGSGPPGPPPARPPNQSAAGAAREGGTAAMAGWGARPARGRLRAWGRDRRQHCLLLNGVGKANFPSESRAPRVGDSPPRAAAQRPARWPRASRHNSPTGAHRQKGIKEQQPAFKMFLLLNGQLCYNSFPPVKSPPPIPIPHSHGGVQGAGVTAHWSWSIQANRNAPGVDGGRKPVKVYSLSLCEMNRTVLCNTAPSSATAGFFCPAPAAWKTVWGKIFQSIHMFSIKNTDSPVSTKAVRL